MHRCPARKQLQRLLARQVAGAEAAALERHVQECARCQGTLEELTRNQEAADWRRMCADRPGTEPTPEGDFLRKLKELPPPPPAPE
jgi:hypothetical protein